MENLKPREKVKPCPFCASSRVKIDEPHITHFPAEIYYHVVCDECFARGPAGESRSEAIKHWNMRGEK